MSATPTDTDSPPEPTSSRTSTQAERTAARTVPDDMEGRVITDFEEAPYPALAVAGAKAAGKAAAAGVVVGAAGAAYNEASDAALGITSAGDRPTATTPDRSSVDDLIELHEETSN